MMIVSFEVTQIRDLHREGLDTAYAERQRQGATLSEEVQTYYQRRGHRMHLIVTDTEHTMIPMPPCSDLLYLLREVEADVNAQLVAAGARTAELGWKFSERAGCPCTCSPGFYIQGLGVEKLACLTVIIDPQA